MRTFVELSTGHLPQAVVDRVANAELSVAGAPVYQQPSRLYFSAFVWVPGDVDDFLACTDDEEDTDPAEPELVALWRYARARGADYILLDSDGPFVDELPTWDW